MMEKATLRQFLAAFSATLGFFICGQMVGWSSPVLARLTRGESEPHLTSDEASWVVSLFTIGQALTPFLGGYLSNVIGRKFTIISSAVPLLVSWILVITAKSAGVMYAGRIIGGFGTGIVFTVTPMYVGEIAEDRVRGATGTLFQVMLSAGVMFEACIGPYVSVTLLGILSAIIPVLFTAIFIWMPETPYYYLLKNRRNDAEKSLMWLRCTSDPEIVDVELKKMEKFVEEDQVNKGGFKELIRDTASRNALIISVSLILFQDFSGIIALISYSTDIFEASDTSLDASVSVIITGSVQLVLSVVSSSVVDIAGRRPMMILSSIGCAITLAAEGLFFYLKTLPDVDITYFEWLPITAIIIYLIMYIIGVGPIPVAVQGELFPTSVKGISSAITNTVHGCGSSLVGKLYQVVSDEWGVYVSFWIFAGSCVGAAVFSIFVMPETKGKSLMEINEELSRSKKKSTTPESSLMAHKDNSEETKAEGRPYHMTKSYDWCGTSLFYDENTNKNG
ncbi:facilitated trehalose transporter Tret1 [Anabrus simplex]|uniref:facilitated trehalose transporter Tret1 n=1 Tax=Anabrus simplex TaxID=316456 RepID=UPI0035A3625D